MSAIRSSRLAAALLLISTHVFAQSPQHCDSVVAAGRVDSVLTGLFISARRSDGDLAPEHATTLALNVGAAFVAPRPLKLSVFGAAPALRLLRAWGDSAPQLRPPNIIGVYEVRITSADSTPRIRTVRTSLISGFDSAAIEAIRGASTIRGTFSPPNGEDSMRVNIRLSTDSTPGARRIVSAYFPRMPVVDAIPLGGDAIPFPDSARAQGLTAGNVVLRFIVGRDGVPEPGTAEAVRATDIFFLGAAAEALSSQRFRPATIHGCPVAQVVDLPISFFLPEPPQY